MPHGATGHRRSPVRSSLLRQGAAVLGLALAVVAGCNPARAGPTDASRQAERERMVREQIAQRGVADPEVLAAMRTVPRHLFVPENWRRAAYEDRPLPIGEGQTISQPYIVARMTELAELDRQDRVFELGTGSGYQAAVASRIAAHVYTVELEPALAKHARDVLSGLGYDNVTVRVGDGTRGWPGHAPFDAVLVTAAFPEIPPALIDQLAPGGRAVLPVGPAGGTQELVVVEKDAAGRITSREVFPVRFVPGRHEP